MFGIYRRTSGDTIVKSSFDYNTSTIGPYTLPIKVNHIPTENVNKFREYKFYEVMLNDPQALAVFNVNNYCLAVLTRYAVYQVPPRDGMKLDLVNWVFKEPLKFPVYEHIGFVKSYHECLAVTQMPTHLIRKVASNKAEDFTETLQCNPVVNPPLQLYKELLNSDAKAVYMDAVTQQPVFLYK